MENPLQTAFCSSNVEILTFRVTVVYVMCNNALCRRFYFSDGRFLFLPFFVSHSGVECDYGTSTKLMALLMATCDVS